MSRPVPNLNALTLAAWLWLPLLVCANENPPATSPLPNPLSLQQALSLADKNHPDIALARARLEQAQAGVLEAESITELRSSIDIAAQTTRLATTDEFENDSFARLLVTKPLYDFGYSNAQAASSTALVNSRQLQLMDERAVKQYEITRLFYQVLLADMKYTADHEDMVQRFLKYDKIRERFSLGMVSEVEVRKAENYYREALSQRAITEGEQKSTRLLLAIALNRPDDLPDQLLPPDLSYHKQALPDGRKLHAQAQSTNPMILSIAQQVEAARSNLEAQRSRHHPNLTAELELAQYERETNNRDEVRAMLNLNIPLFPGKQSRARIASAQADLAEQTARLRQAEQSLLVAIMSQVKQLGILYADRVTALQRVEFRDLSLDHRRALYELEVQTDMSSAQAKMTEAHFLLKKIDYDIALAWNRLNLLTGKSLLHQEAKIK